MDLTPKACCVTGHRRIPFEKLDYVRQELEREVSEALADGYTLFITGFAEGTDMLFARIVQEHRASHPKIFLEAAIPYRGRVRKLTSGGKLLLGECDGVNITSESYHPECYFRRNRYMVRSSNRVIAVYDGRESGGTFFTIDYAKSMGRDVRVIGI
jgi:uncharacterized phage-like protein YoqJ